MVLVAWNWELGSHSNTETCRVITKTIPRQYYTKALPNCLVDTIFIETELWTTSGLSVIMQYKTASLQFMSYNIVGANSSCVLELSTCRSCSITCSFHRDFIFLHIPNEIKNGDWIDEAALVKCFRWQNNQIVSQAVWKLTVRKSARIAQSV